MAITELTVEGYRSIRDIHLKLGQINVLVGANGCGKSNLYRSMFLVAAAASGELARTIAEEGGMPSVLWAGHRGKGPVRMVLGATVNQLTYELQLGLAAPNEMPEPFLRDPRIKEEHVWFANGKKRETLLERGVSSVWLRDADGKRISYTMALSGSESVFTQLREPHRFPQLSALREEILSWRFYHHFRTDALSPLRQPQIGVFTPVLSHDGIDLAAALETIRVIGDHPALLEAVERAFPGAKLASQESDKPFLVRLAMPGFQRPFDARELSDGTLRYLCLLAALLTPRPPSVLALNEPEASLHPDLLEPLARLIVDASRRSQLWITTHSQELANQIERYSGVPAIALEKVGGETQLRGEKYPDLLAGFRE